MSAAVPSSDPWPPLHTFSEASTPAQRAALAAVQRRRQLAAPAFRALCRLALGDHADRPEIAGAWSKGQAMLLLDWFSRVSAERLKSREREAIESVFGGSP